MLPWLHQHITFISRAQRLSLLPYCLEDSKELLHPSLPLSWDFSSYVLEWSSFSSPNQPRMYRMRQFLLAILTKFEQLLSKNNLRQSQRQMPFVERLQ